MSFVEMLRCMFDEKQNLCTRENQLSNQRNNFHHKSEIEGNCKGLAENKRDELEEKLYLSLNLEQRKMFDELIHMNYDDFDTKEYFLIDFVWNFAKQVFK